MQGGGTGGAGGFIAEVDGDAVQYCAHGIRFDHPCEALNHGLGDQELSGELAEGFADDGHGIGAGDELCGIQGQAQHVLVELLVVFEVALVFAVLYFVERWLGDVHIAALDEFGHLAEQEREE